MRFNMKTGSASQRKLSAPAVDFPRVNESYTGRYAPVFWHNSGLKNEQKRYLNCA